MPMWGTATVVDMARNEEIAYQELLDFAQKENRPRSALQAGGDGPAPLSKAVDP